MIAHDGGQENVVAGALCVIIAQHQYCTAYARTVRTVRSGGTGAAYRISSSCLAAGLVVKKLKHQIS